MAGSGRAKANRELRRAAQFAKFRNTELNLVPLVDTMVAVVFFSLATATVGDLAPVAPGVDLPLANVQQPALKELTVGIGSDISIDGERVMSSRDAAGAVSNNPREPLIVPALLAALQTKADSIRQATNTPANQSVTIPLAIQGSKTMRYDLLSRVLHTARWAGFRNVTLQVQRPEAVGAPQPAA